MNWCFAIVNGKLAEIYFETNKGKPKILGHCLVKKVVLAHNRKMDQWISEYNQAHPDNPINLS